MTITVFRIGHSLSSVLTDQAYGSTLFDGRWHSLRTGSRPRRVIYGAASRALAQLEKRVHANGVLPVNQALFALRFDDADRIATAHDLPVNWHSDIASSQAYGNDWIDSGVDLALWVPSFVEPAESNIVINADHPALHTIEMSVERDPFIFDPRLMS